MPDAPAPYRINQSGRDGRRNIRSTVNRPRYAAMDPGHKVREASGEILSCLSGLNFTVSHRLVIRQILNLYTGPN